MFATVKELKQTVSNKPRSDAIYTSLLTDEFLFSPSLPYRYRARKRDILKSFLKFLKKKIWTQDSLFLTTTMFICSHGFQKNVDLNEVLVTGYWLL